MTLQNHPEKTPSFILSTLILDVIFRVREFSTQHILDRKSKLQLSPPINLYYIVGHSTQLTILKEFFLSLDLHLGPHMTSDLQYITLLTWRFDCLTYGISK